MAKIEIRCTECGHEARVPEAFRGKKVRCLRCRARLRVPGGDPNAASASSTDAHDAGASARPRGRERPLAQSAGAGASKLRREVQQSIREILGDCEHAIESTQRGFDVDVRGVAFGLARTLAEDLLGAPGVRDVKLAGGTGECRITVTIEGASFDPADSFADDDDETEIFRKPSAPGPKPFEEKDAESQRPRSAAPDRRTASPDRGPSASASKKTRDRERDLASEATTEPTRERNKPYARSDGLDSLPRPRERSAGAGNELDQKTAEGERLLEAGEMQAAVEILERVVGVDKNHAPAVSALGNAYARLGDNDRARRAFKHLAKLRPDDPDPLIFHAAAAVQCDRLEDAREALASAIKLDPENARAYKYAAVLYDRLGDPERSKKFRAKYEALKGR